MASLPAPEVPRGELTPQALGVWFTKFSVWMKDRDRRLVALEGGSSGAGSSGADGTDWGSYRHKPGNSSLSPWYIAGHVAGVYTGATAAPAANNFYAVPFIAPKRGGTLSSVAWRSTRVTGNGRIAVYSNKAADNLYPDALLADGGSVAQTNALKTSAVSVVLTAGQLYWLAYVASGSNAVHLLDPTVPAVAAILGTSFATDINAAIKVAFTFGAAPATFPAGGAYVIAAASETPALGYQVS